MHEHPNTLPQRLTGLVADLLDEFEQQVGRPAKSAAELHAALHELCIAHLPPDTRPPPSTQPYDQLLTHPPSGT